MSDHSPGLPRILIVFGICVPLALIVGYLLATPTDVLSFGIVGIVIFALCFPLLLRWHHAALILAWNANIIVFFLPGEPSLWMLLAGLSLFLTLLASVMDKQIYFQNVPSLTWPLVFLGLVILVTAKLTGGIGLRSLGSGTYGGRKFVFVVAAIVGYYAISSQRIPDRKAQRYVGLFFLSGVTSAVSNLIYLGGPAFYFLYLIFPTDYAVAQAIEDFSGPIADVRLGRLPGVTGAAMAAFYYVLARYGIQGVLDLRKFWRLFLALLCFGLSLLGGFRSAVIIFALICIAQFCFEGLFRKRLSLALIIAFIVVGASLTPFVDKLPLSVQRSLSVVPFIDIDASARQNADASLDWRLKMWEALRPQIRQYFFLGKGYAIDPTDMYLTGESVRRGLASDYEASMVAGDYHSGPLSVLIPFGVFGLAAFVWLLGAGFRVLWKNHRYSEPSHQSVNTFLISYFTARAVFYFVGFGSFSSDLPLFLGLLGFSVALNKGVRVPASVPSAVPPQPADPMIPTLAFNPRPTG